MVLWREHDRRADIESAPPSHERRIADETFTWHGLCFSSRVLGILNHAASPLTDAPVIWRSSKRGSSGGGEQLTCFSFSDPGFPTFLRQRTASHRIACASADAVAVAVATRTLTQIPE